MGRPQLRAECRVVGCEWRGVVPGGRPACGGSRQSRRESELPRSGIRDSSVGLGRAAASCGEAVLTEGQECRGLAAVPDEGVLSRKTREPEPEPPNVTASRGAEKRRRGARPFSRAATQSPRGGGRAAGVVLAGRRATAVTGGASESSDDWHEVAMRAAVAIFRRWREWQAASKSRSGSREAASPPSD